MNKKLLSLAVATAFAAPLAQASEMTWYGVADVSLNYFTVGTALNTDGPAGADPSDGADYWDLNSGASRLGIKGSEDLGNGLKAIYKMEFQVRLTDNNNDINDGDQASQMVARNTYVGLAGDWGTFLAGRHDTPLKISTGALDLFADTVGDYNQGGLLVSNPVDGVEAAPTMPGLGFVDARADNAVAYVSPNMNGFTLAAAIVPSGNSTVATAGLGAGTDNNRSNNLVDAYSVAAMYSNGPFYASLAYETYDMDTAAVTLASDLKAGVDLLRVGLGYTANNFHVGFVYEDQNVDPNATLTGVLGGQSADVQVWQLSGSYAFGNNVLKAAYGERSAGNAWATGGALANITEDDADQWSLGLDHNFSKKTKAYAVYTDVDSSSANADWSAFSMGLRTNF